MDSLTLYTNPMSRGRIARWMLEETGATYDTVILDYGTTMVAPEYRAIDFAKLEPEDIADPAAISDALAA